MHVAYNRGRGVFFRMNVLRPLPRRFTRLATFLVLCAWIATMAVLVHRALLEASPNFSSNLPRYGSSAEWRGVYYRNDVYREVTAWESFEPWLTRLETMPAETVYAAASEVPPEWSSGRRKGCLC